MPWFVCLDAGAHRSCDGCNFDKGAAGSRTKAFSFLRGKGRCKWKLRKTADSVLKINFAFDHIKGIGKRAQYLRKQGLRSTLKTVTTPSLLEKVERSSLASTAQRWFALHPKFIPGYVESDMSTQDGQHLEADGLLPCESPP